MTPEMRDGILTLRKEQNLPWHSPRHVQGGKLKFHITASCYEHHPIIGISPTKMSEFEQNIVGTIRNACENIYAWTILPNHYHILLKTNDLKSTLKLLHQVHGRTSYAWNKEENHRGRRVWFNVLEHGIKSERHFWATVNYIHNNPVKHSYVKKIQDWPYSSFNIFLKNSGREEAIRIWKEYDIGLMGKDWDIY